MSSSLGTTTLHKKAPAVPGLGKQGLLPDHQGGRAGAGAIMELGGA